MQFTVYKSGSTFPIVRRACGTVHASQHYRYFQYLLVTHTVDEVLSTIGFSYICCLQDLWHRLSITVTNSVNEKCARAKQQSGRQRRISVRICATIFRCRPSFAQQKARYLQTPPCTDVASLRGALPADHFPPVNKFSLPRIHVISVQHSQSGRCAGNN